MADEKTIILTGEETEVVIDGQNCDIRNDGTDTVYISRSAGLVADADGVMSVPAGQAAKLLDVHGSVFLLGTGKVQLCGNDYAQPVFKCAPNNGGSGCILVNPNFSVNQRGQAEYIGAGTTVDCWKLARTGNRLTVLDSGVELGFEADSTPSGTAHLFQKIENFADFAGKKVTASAFVAATTSAKPQMLIVYTLNGTRSHSAVNLVVGKNAVTADIPEGITDLQLWLYGAYPSAGDTAAAYTRFGYVKLECGAAATLFCPPHPAEELAKCQRYYQLRSTGDIDPTDLRPTMRTITDIRQREDGKYECIAEL